MKNDYILEMKGILKQYPGVTALKGVDFRVQRGTIHCLVGENGAGKSTLIKIITCAEKMTAGEMLVDGVPFSGKTVKDAMNAGISTVFQELNIINQLTVEDNLTLGRESHRLGIIQKEANDPVLRLMAEFAPDIALERRVSDLSLAEKQIVETIKAIGTDAKIVIMDEPTAALSSVEAQRLYTFVKKLRDRKITIIYISHILDDIFTLGDEVTALRDGNIIGTRPVSNTNREELIRMMIGKSVHSQYNCLGRTPGSSLLRVNNMTTNSVRGLSFELKQNEIIGFYGLRGSGKSETARGLFGLDEWISGQLCISDQKAEINNPKQAILHGIAMVPEERLSEGLFMKLSVTDNIAITGLKQESKFGIVNERFKNNSAKKYVKELNIKVSDLSRPVATLSGGNQQKVVISKYLNAQTTVLLLDEPTRGIDVGSKEEIYTIVRELASKGKGVIIFSSEFEEIANLCDRVFILSAGSLVAEMRHDELDAERVRHLTMGKGA